MPDPRPSLRPPPEKRTFSSPCVEDLLESTAATIADPELAWLFSNCFPNTLDTTVSYTPEDPTTNKPDTFIITGDIHAMWLRDSTNQVWPYLQHAKHCAHLRNLLRGLIHRQARCVLLDPYANAFYKDPTQTGEWKSDHTRMLPGIHERKYELDSLCSVLRLATGYVEATADITPIDSQFLDAARLILATIKYEQAGTPEQLDPPYSFARSTPNASDTLPGSGHGNPCRRTGMSRSPFRPSDDASTFQYHIPSNAMAVVMLRKLGEVLAKNKIKGAEDLAANALLLSHEIHRALRTHAIFPHPTLGPLFPYEIDGYGGCLFMDEANVPSLLSLPYLGYCSPTDPIYQHTRQFILSPDNPYYHDATGGGKGGYKGIGSPHVGMGWIWPLSLITQALTSTNDEEILSCLKTLKASHAGTGFMHEAFWFQNPQKFTRSWFAWANTYFGELILHLATTRPHLLKENLS